MIERDRLSSVANAARVLKAFNSRNREYGVSELARKLGMSTSTVHRLLSTLTSEHLIEQDPDSSKYRLGLAIYDLVAAVTAGFDLSHAVLQPMAVLRNQAGGTVHVAVLDGREVVYVERLDSPHTLRLFLEVGRRNWAHCTCTGKVLLAHLSPAELNQILDGWELHLVSPKTITDHQDLRKVLGEVKDTGFAMNDGESETGVLSVGAPIRDHSQNVVAAMSVVGPADRMNENLRATTFAVMEAAAAASRRLGYSKEG
ncbi:MAG TPA: IclR family transcriptional regulator [Actinobacteria bacterium]|nr:IclR family transcriptional regulator [Actinomycetota bacterium]